MSIWRRFGAIALLFPCVAAAQSYPSRLLRIVVGFTPGGVADAVGRLVAQGLTAQLGQNVLVDNRGGASGAIANEVVAKSAPDGHTLLVIGNTAAMLPALRSNLAYDLEKDLGAVCLVATAPFVLVVHPSVPARNAGELIALARARPGKLSYGSVGVGSSPHLSAALFGAMAKIDILHVPYKGGGENAAASAAGHIDMSFLSIPSHRPLAGSGRVRALAVTGARRSSLLPDLPTVGESGLPGYEYSSWNGVVAPAGLPKEILARLNTAIVRAVATPEVKEGLMRQGLEPQSGTPQQFAVFIQGEIAKNARLAKLAGIKAE